MDKLVLPVLFALLGIFVVPVVISNLIRHFRGKKMLNLAKAQGPMWVTNSEKGVTAVCHYETFMESMDAWVKKTQSESDPRKKVELQVTKMRFFVFPTFTFTDEENRVPAHTGVEEEGEEILFDLVFKVTGYHNGQVDDKDYQKVVDLLVRKDKRLLIPFLSNHADGLGIDHQVAQFGSKSLSEARAHLTRPNNK